MLGRTEAALAMLPSLEESNAAPSVAKLRGTIYETRGDWRAALASYQKARNGWESRPPSPERSAGLLQSTTGMAFCQRKMGRYADAEVMYGQVLALSPSADSHFLLAQFYEDTQQAAKARMHARRAIALSPARYREEGEKLIRKLSVFQFGCLGVFAAERGRSGASLGAGSVARP
jgi:tetratricopeptide (TPR) repeat protein